MSPELGATALPDVAELASTASERFTRARRLVARSDALIEATRGAIASSKSVLPRVEQPAAKNDRA